MLYWYGLTLGLQALTRGKFSPLLITPVNYWRMLEFRLVFDELNARPTDTILDIGSPKLFSLFLADRIGCEVFSTDIDDYFVEEYRFFQKIKRVPESRFHPVVADGRKLQFPDARFSKVFSISVIEHIPGEGDGECMQEIARVLAPGGKCVITVPFAPNGKTVYTQQQFYWSRFSATDPATGQAFFERAYSEEELHRRLIEPSGLKATRINYVGENVLTKSDRELADFLRPSTGPFQPLLSKLCLSRPVARWQHLKKPLCALLVLEKPTKVASAEG